MPRKKMVKQAYIISRLRDEGRQQWAAAQMDALCLDYRFFPAMCPDGVRWGSLNSRVRGTRRQTAFGCLLSHYHALQDAYLNESDALIFEDDFLPMPDFAFNFADLPTADMYFFGWITWGAEPKTTPVNEQWHRRESFAGTHCYFVPYNRLQKVLTWFDRSKWDVQIDNAWSNDQAAGRLDLLFKSGPRVIQNTNLGSTIGNNPHPKDVDFAKSFLTKQF
jgi:hypothetical protein